jgi:hypothetical protein
MQRSCAHRLHRHQRGYGQNPQHADDGRELLQQALRRLFLRIFPENPAPHRIGHPEHSGLRRGGIIATILDEIMVNVVSLRGSPAVTGRMTPRLWKPVLVGERSEPSVMMSHGTTTSEQGRTPKETLW